MDMPGNTGKCVLIFWVGSINWKDDWRLWKGVCLQSDNYWSRWGQELLCGFKKSHCILLVALKKAIRVPVAECEILRLSLCSAVWEQLPVITGRGRELWGQGAPDLCLELYKNKEVAAQWSAGAVPNSALDESRACSACLGASWRSDWCSGKVQGSVCSQRSHFSTVRASSCAPELWGSRVGWQGPPALTALLFMGTAAADGLCCQGSSPQLIFFPDNLLHSRTLPPHWFFSVFKAK